MYHESPNIIRITLEQDLVRPKNHFNTHPSYIYTLLVENCSWMAGETPLKPILQKRLERMRVGRKSNGEKRRIQWEKCCSSKNNQWLLWRSQNRRKNIK